METVAMDITMKPIQIPLGKSRLPGDLAMPAGARGLVLFVHGSRSSRHSPRNRMVAEVMNRAGLGTLLFDLLTAEEEAEDIQTGELRFNIPMLAVRLSMVTDWLWSQGAMRRLLIGYFGASTGAAAALVAAAENPSEVAVIVSRGGRPDLAGEALENVLAPTLLIVGGKDEMSLQLNQAALRRLGCKKELQIVSRATHLFEEPGALEQVAAMAADWFQRFLRAPARAVPLEVW